MNWSNQTANIIQQLRLTFLSLSISGIVTVESNTFYKYEYEYKQASVLLLETLKITCGEVHM